MQILQSRRLIYIHIYFFVFTTSDCLVIRFINSYISEIIHATGVESRLEGDGVLLYGLKTYLGSVIIFRCKTENSNKS